MFAEEERLVNDPIEERRIRTFISQASSLSNQNVPRTPKRTLSFNSSTYTNTNINAFDTERKPLYTTTQKDIAPTTSKREYFMNILFKVLRVCVFQFFMIYWIVKEPIIRTVTFFTMIVSFILIDPLLFIWSILPAKTHYWKPSLKRRQQLASFCTLILFIVFLSPVIKSYIPKLKALDLFDTDKSQQVIDIDNSKLWKTLKHMNQELLELSAKVNQHESKLTDQQYQIDEIRDSIDKQVKIAIEHQLPEMILVHTNEKGELELSPQFFAYLKDTSFWDQFLQQNDVAIKKYLEGELNQFFENQKKQGAIIGKDAFLKLLSNALVQNEGNTNISFDGLIETAIKRYHQDVLNTADFALKSRGAEILYSMTSPTFYPLSAWVQGLKRIAGLPTIENSPEMAITPSTYPGECWQMHGNKGQLAIALSQPILIQGITVEYPSAEVMMNKLQNAPKDMIIYGLNNSQERTLLSQITYNIHGDTSIQTFDITMNPTEAFRAVAIQIKSNWGSVDHTDIYRIRIHGIPISSDV